MSEQYGRLCTIFRTDSPFSRYRMALLPFRSTRKHVQFSVAAFGIHINTTIIQDVEQIICRNRRTKYKYPQIHVDFCAVIL